MNHAIAQRLARPLKARTTVAAAETDPLTKSEREGLERYKKATGWDLPLAERFAGVTTRPPTHRRDVA